MTVLHEYQYNVHIQLVSIIPTSCQWPRMKYDFWDQSGGIHTDTQRHTHTQQCLTHRLRDSGSGLVLSTATLWPSFSARSHADTHFCHEPSVSCRGKQSTKKSDATKTKRSCETYLQLIPLTPLWLCAKLAKTKLVGPVTPSITSCIHGRIVRTNVAFPTANLHFVPQPSIYSPCSRTRSLSVRHEHGRMWIYPLRRNIGEAKIPELWSRWGIGAE